MPTLIGALTIGTAAPAGAQERALDREFGPTIEAFISARNASLLEPGHESKAFSSPQDVALLHKAVPAFRSREHDIRRALEPSRAVLALGGVRYVGASTDIRITSIAVNGREATVRFTEEDRDIIAGMDGEWTGQNVKRTAAFTRDGLVWSLRSLRAGEDFSGIGKPMNEPTAAQLAGDYSAADTVRRELATAPAAGAVQNDSPLPSEGVSAMAYANRYAVRDYALRYALNYNPTYKRFNNDCTNFVSQAVRAGGWAMIGGGSTNKAAWWYRRDTWPDSNSHTWSVADDFYYHGTWFSKRLRYVPHNTIWVGDVVQVAFAGQTRLGHAMVVTVAQATDGRGFC